MTFPELLNRVSFNRPYGLCEASPSSTSRLACGFFNLVYEAVVGHARQEKEICQAVFQC